MTLKFCHYFFHLVVQISLFPGKAQSYNKYSLTRICHQQEAHTPEKVSIITDLLELLTLIHKIFMKLTKQSIYCLMSPLHDQSEHPLSQTRQFTSLPSCRPNGLNYTDIHTSCLHYEMCSQGERIWLGQPLTSLLLIYGFNTLHPSKLLPGSGSLHTLSLSWSYPGSPFTPRCEAEKSVLNNRNLKHLVTKTSSQYLCLSSKLLNY